MRKGETSRLEEFWRNQNSFDSGTRVLSGLRPGFIIDWNLHGFPLQGNFSILYDSGDYREYDAFYLRYIRGAFHPTNRWLNDSDVVENAYKRYCENLFLGKLRNEG